MRRLHTKGSNEGVRRGVRTGVAALLLATTAVAPKPAHAGAALQIMPVLIDVPAGAQISTVNVANQDSRPAPVQIRIFKWTQSNGEEKLEATQDVVASPPIASIAPHATLNVRVVRVSKQPVTTEESYRLVIDQLPRSDAGGRSIVSILLRQVLPVFFAPAERAPPDVAWSLAPTAHGYVLQARNSGGRRLRIGKAVLSGAGAPIKLSNGLFGYALAHSDMSWTIPPRRASFAPNKRLTLRGESDVGALDATVPVSSAK